MGFQSLIIVYLFFVLFDPLSAVFVSRYGAKKCMIISSVFYSLFIVSLLSNSVLIIYSASSLLGIAASFLWTAQTSYLIRASDKKYYGRNSGFFNTSQSLGTAAGAFSLGFFISLLSFKASFLIFSLFPILGFLFLFRLEDIKIKNNLNHLKLVRKSVLSKTALRLASMGFAANFIYGLVIGIIPVEIKSVLGIFYIGILSSLFYIMPILLSYAFGTTSDVKGRKSMIMLSYATLIIGLLLLSVSNGAFLLVSGIVLLAVSWAILMPATFALIGDVSTKNNLEFFSALFWMVENIGILCALVLSSVLKSEPTIIYLISIIVLLTSLTFLLPLLRMKISKIKQRLNKEIC